MDHIELIEDKINNGLIPKLNACEIYPSISIVTPTFNRHDLIDIAIFNWNNFIYPDDKIEWIILDDSPRDSIVKTKKKIPKDDKRIKYYTCKKINTIGKKRNKINELANNDIIVHMDDDDYYPPDSVINRVCALLTYDKKCVGSSGVNCINLLDNTCFKTQGGYIDDTIVTAEASLTYYKNFWLEQKFNEEDMSEECKNFLKFRSKDYIDLNTAFVMIAITHSLNMSDRVLKNTINQFDFFKELPVEVVNMLEKIQFRIHSKLPGMQESKDFIKENYGRPNEIIFNKIKKLPIYVKSTTIMSCYIEELTIKEQIVKKTLCVIYYPGLYYRNIELITSSGFSHAFYQLIFFLRYYYHEYKIRLYTYTHDEFSINNNITVIPWYYFNCKLSSDEVLLVDEYSHMDIVNKMCKNNIIYLNLSNLNIIYPPNFLDSLELYYTFGNKSNIIFNNDFLKPIKFTSLKYFYIGQGKELNNNQLFLDTVWDKDLNKYSSIHTYDYNNMDIKDILRDNDINCEFYLIKEDNLSLMSYLIYKGVKYLCINKNEKMNELGIISINDEIPPNYFEILNNKLKNVLKII